MTKCNTDIPTIHYVYVDIGIRMLSNTLRVMRHYVNEPRLLNVLKYQGAGSMIGKSEIAG